MIEWSEQHQLMRDAVRKFVEAEIAPNLGFRTSVTEVMFYGGDPWDECSNETREGVRPPDGASQYDGIAARKLPWLLSRPPHKTPAIFEFVLGRFSHPQSERAFPRWIVGIPQQLTRHIV